MYIYIIYTYIYIYVHSGVAEASEYPCRFLVQARPDHIGAAPDIYIYIYIYIW